MVVVSYCAGALFIFPFQSQCALAGSASAVHCEKEQRCTDGRVFRERVHSVAIDAHSTSSGLLVTREQ